MSPQTATLSNGLRVVFEPYNSEVLYCGYLVMAGTRNEEPDDAGMAHFIEHLSFKGTQHRRAYHINGCLERVGGELNAFTNKQETVYHATVLRKDFVRAADVLTDIVFHSTYPQREIDREVEVICDEIDSFLDSPADLVFDEFESLLFPGQPLGRDILGKKERLRSYTTADARRFADRYYRPDNCVFFVYGNISFRHVVGTLERLTPSVPAAPPAPKPVTETYSPMETAKIVRQRGTHQAHVVMGTRTFGGSDDRRFALMLLNNLLGGPGMNSRLNRRLREKAGLVYSVDSYLYTYLDTGVWEVYFGCDTHDVERCERLVRAEMRGFIDKPLSPAALAAARKQLCGQIGISRDARGDYALSLGKAFAWYGRQRDVDEMCRRIAAVTADDIVQVAREVFERNGLLTLVYAG